MRHFLTQYYQLIPDWMGHLSENSYRLAFYLFYRARKAPIDETGSFRIKIDDIIHYIGLPTKEEVKNRNYDEAIIRPFNKAVEEIESISNGSIHMDFDYDDINTFLAGRMNVGIDQTLWDYIQKLDKTRAAKQLKGKTSHKKRRRPKTDGDGLHETTSELPSERPPVPGHCAETAAHFSTGNPFSGRFP